MSGPVLDISTQLLHADEHGVRGADPAVGVPISTSTVFRRGAPDDPRFEVDAETLDWRDPPIDFYSRYAQPTLTRTEKVLGAALNGHALAYPSGLAATFAALAHYKPSVVAIQGGYFGVHETMRTYARIRDGKFRFIDIDEEFPQSTDEERLVCWIESPVNPIGEARDIRFYANKAKKAGGRLVVDSTFAPPPLSDPFKHGADLIMHSGSKYFGGHSDALSGVLATQDKGVWDQLWHDRTYTGNNLGSLESWLILRSLRTHNLRVSRQARTGTELAQWLASLASQASTVGTAFDNVPGGIILHAWHASLQASVDSNVVIQKFKVTPSPDTPRKGARFNPFQVQDGDEEAQLKDGPACFAILLSKPEYAKWLPALTKILTHATSLGGVESLIEQRFKSDSFSDPRIVRISVGLEHLDDLKADFRQAFVELLKREASGKLV